MFELFKYLKYRLRFLRKKKAVEVPPTKREEILQIAEQLQKTVDLLSFKVEDALEEKMFTAADPAVQAMQPVFFAVSRLRDELLIDFQKNSVTRKAE